MKNWRTFIVAAFTIFIFWFIKFYLNFPSADVGIIGVILTIASILFGFLAGFFISELWTRYTEIRELQGLRTSEGLNMIKYAQHFYSNKNFEKDFKSLVEKTAIVDEVIEWDEGHLEVPHFQNIEDSFDYINVKNEKDEIYFDNLMDSYNRLVESMVRLDTLYKERLFISEWLIVSVLSVVISVSMLFLDVSHFFYQIIVIIFPAIISLALSIIYDLNTLAWSRENVTLEPNERILDAIGAKRFYTKKNLRFVSKEVKDYRTEKDLEGELKEVYMSITGKKK